MRGNMMLYILLTLVIFMIFGVVSLGDVVSVIFYIFLGIVLLALIAFVAIRVKFSRIRKQMEKEDVGSTQYRTYTWTSGNSRNRNKQQQKPDGEVTIQRTAAADNKRISNDIGDYVDYEEEIEEVKEE